MAKQTKEFLAQTLANRQPRRYHASVCAIDNGLNCNCKTLTDAYRIIEQEFSKLATTL